MNYETPVPGTTFGGASMLAPHLRTLCLAPMRSGVLAEDPNEMRNLAAEGSDHLSIVEELNKKLTHLLDAEIGVHDDGRYLPSVPGMSWAAPDLTNV